MRRPPCPRLASELYRYLIASGETTVASISRRSGLGVDLLYAMASGRRHILLEHEPQLVSAARSLPLFDALTGARDLGIGTFWLPGGVPSGRGALEITFEALRTASAFVTTALDAVEDKILTAVEKAQLRISLREVIARCAELEKALGEGTD